MPLATDQKVGGFESLRARFLFPQARASIWSLGPETATDRHDEAARTALEAISSGRIVPSNYWRAREVIRAVALRGVPEAADLAEAYRETYGDGERPALP
jgi:hypothetical protein